MNRAYSLIIDYILQFSMSYIREGEDSDYPRCFGSSTGFVNCSFGSPIPQVVDLVRLDSMRDPDFRLGWLLEIRGEPENCMEYLVKSIKTGKEIWWGNVGISYFHRRTLNCHPEWQWTDKQFEFESLWKHVCAKDAPYIYLPCSPEFVGTSVKLSVRVRFGISSQIQEVMLENWAFYLQKKTGYTQQKLLQCYRDMVAIASEPKVKKDVE